VLASLSGVFLFQVTYVSELLTQICVYLSAGEEYPCSRIIPLLFLLFTYLTANGKIH
jgi:hypothetical protein